MPSDPSPGGVPAVDHHRPTPLRIAVLVFAVLAAVASVAAVGYGISWARAANDSDLDFAQARDDVLRDAGQAAVNLNTLDFERVDQGLELWEQSSTGQVLDDFRANRQQYADFIAQSQRTVTATVVDSAVAELDTDDRTARVLMVLEIVTTPQGEQPTTSRQRLDIQLEEVDQSWKVSSVGPTAPQPAAPTLPPTPTTGAPPR